MARKAALNVYGPYKRGNRWRVILKSGSVCDPRSFSTEAEALAFRDEARLQVEGRTVMQSIDDYIDHLEKKGRALTTRRAIRAGLYRILPDRGIKVASIGIAKATSLYEALANEYAVASHQYSLGEAVTMWDWMIQKQWATDNPWEAVETIGVPRRGKDQLSLDEARKFAETAYACAERHPGAVTALLALMLGMRAGEIVSLRGRDIDDGGRLVRIVRGKTHKARRTLEVPERLRPFLRELAERAGSLGMVFNFTRPRVWRWARKVCVKAGVTVVCPHGLRATHSTLALEAGATAHLVAAALGHASPAVTRAHYLRPGAEDAVTAGRFGDVLDGNGSSEYCVRTPPDDVN